jgi:DNA-binding SARP family transcriptional activator
MGTLQIYLLGNMRVINSEYPEELRLTPAVQALLAYLVLRRDCYHSRQKLAGLFWGEVEEKRAQNCLRTALWRLRQVLEPGETIPGTYLITTANHEVGFNCNSDYWLDVQMLEQANGYIRALPETLEGTQVTILESAIDLYKGDLLATCYEDWVITERARLEQAYVAVLTWLMRYHRQLGNHNKSVTYGEKILSLDPLREGIHREMIELYIEMREQTLALRQYQRCEQVLAEELNVKPMPETKALIATVLRSRQEDSNTFQAYGFRQLLVQLEQSLLRLEETREQVVRTIEMMRYNLD